MSAGFYETAAGRRALANATTPEKLAHIFAPKHKLEPLVAALGGRRLVVRALLAEISGRVPQGGAFEVFTRFHGQEVVVRGAVVDGTIRIGTVFTP